MTQIGNQPVQHTPVSSPTVDAVTADVARLTDASGVFNTVTNSEVRRATTALSELSPAEADTVIDRLHENGQLDQLAREVMDGWVGGGLSASDRGDFMRAMAQRLDGQSLARLSDAFAAADSGIDGFNAVNELADAVSRHSSLTARVEYVRAQAGKTTDQPTTNLFSIDGQRRVGDAEARGIGVVLSSLNQAPDAAREAFQILADTPGATDAVLKASLNEEQDWGALNGWHTDSMDKTLYRDVMQTAANMERAAFGTPAETATTRLADGIFDAGARVIDPSNIERADIIERSTRVSPEVSELAAISHAVYQRTGAPEGVTRISDAQLQELGINPGLLSKPDIGFEAGLYQTQDGGYVLAFRGTDAWSTPEGGLFDLAADTDDNLLQGAGYGSLQHTAATVAATEVVEVVGAENLRITGHSLGGGLAATASGRTGVEAVTFNAAGVADETISAHTLSYAPGQVTNYHTSGDIMTFLNDGPLPTPYARLLGLDGIRDLPAAVGTQVEIGNPLGARYLEGAMESWWPGTIKTAADFGVNEHLMPTLIEQIR